MTALFDKRPLRKTDVKETNEKLALYLVRSNGPISQPEIARETGLKPPTILRIFHKLHQQRYIQLHHPSDSVSDRPGRKAVQYVINGGAFYAIGVDFYARLVSVVIEDFAGRVVAQTTHDLAGSMQADEILFEMKKVIWSTIADSGISKNEILGIGIGSPGVVDTQDGVVVFYSRIGGMRNVPIKREVEDAFGVPVIIHNNCSVIAQSEYSYGPVRGVKSLIVLLVRGGLGGAFVKHGCAYFNQERTAFELGHMSVDFRADPCGGRGENGCLERWITEAELVRVAGLASIEELDTSLAQNDEETLRSLEVSAQAFSEAVLTLSNILNPEAFIVVSRSQALSDFLARKAESRHQAAHYTSKDLSIRFVGRVFNPVLACRGAIDLVVDKFFAAEITAPFEREHRLAAT